MGQYIMKKTNIGLTFFGQANYQYLKSLSYYTLAKWLGKRLTLSN